MWVTTTIARYFEPVYPQKSPQRFREDGNATNGMLVFSAAQGALIRRYKVAPKAAPGLWQRRYGFMIRPAINACSMTRGFDKVHTRDLSRESQVLWSSKSGIDLRPLIWHWMIRPVRDSIRGR